MVRPEGAYVHCDLLLILYVFDYKNNAQIWQSKAVSAEFSLSKIVRHCREVPLFT